MERGGSPVFMNKYTVNNYRQVTGIATGENFAFFIYSTVGRKKGTFELFVAR